MLHQRFTILLLVLLQIYLLTGCRKEESSQDEESFHFTSGCYLLNEGNMSMNKASLDFYDLERGVYERDVYKRANPSIVLGLGDVGNDIQVYGQKLYVVVNASNKIEVLNAQTAKRIKVIDLINCRYITFHEGKVYASSYNGAISMGPNTPNGKVVEIDTATLSITREVAVGRQPDGVAIANNKLYVANSGGYNPNAYERTLSIIDIPSFKELKKLDIEINLHRVKSDDKGYLYVTSRGDYKGNHSNLFIIDSKTDVVIDSLGKSISNFWIDGNRLYSYATEWNILEQKNTINYDLFELDKLSSGGRPYIQDGLEKKISIPYGIAVHPSTKDIFITDAKNYVTPGTLYHLNSEGKLLRSFETGDIPAHMAFIAY